MINSHPPSKNVRGARPLFSTRSVRRSTAKPGERAYYPVFAPAETTLAELAGVAGLRWTIEECFERAEGDLGLDHCEGRSWHGWHRHMTLCIAALAFLAKLSANQVR
jgi:SRSO17 transposase